jgi:uncharacterized protein (TIGR03437 family)
MLATLTWAQAPVYNASSIVNAATNQPGALAPLSLVSLYGVNLSHASKALTTDEIRNGQLPTTLIGTGVVVSIDSVAVPILFVSPTQVNFLIPGNTRTGLRRLRLSRGAFSGPEIELRIADSAPGLFTLASQTVIASHTDGRLVSGDAPAEPGELIILYAAGLGATLPALNGLTLPTTAASISARRDLGVLLNGESIADDLIDYAGVTPGFAGLYQINFRVPVSTAPNPEIRLRLPGQISPPSLSLPVRAPLQ